MRVDKQVISYWSMNEKEHALVIDTLQHIGRASAEQVAGLIGENMRTARRYQKDVKDLLVQIGEPVETNHVELPDDGGEQQATPEQLLAELEGDKPGEVYGPFRKSSK